MQKAGTLDDLKHTSYFPLSNQYWNNQQDDSFCAGVQDSGESPTGSAIIDNIPHETTFRVSEKVVMQAQRKPVNLSSNNTLPNTKSNDAPASKLSHPPVKRAASHTVIGQTSLKSANGSDKPKNNNTETTPNDDERPLSPLSTKSLMNRKLNSPQSSPPPRPANPRGRMNTMDTATLASKAAKKTRPPPKPADSTTSPTIPVDEESDSSDEELNGMSSSRLPTKDNSAVVELARDTIVLDPSTVEQSLTTQQEASSAAPSQPKSGPSSEAPKRPVKMPSRPPPALPPGVPEPPRRPVTAKPAVPPRTPSATKLTAPPSKQAAKPQGSISATQGNKIATSIASANNTPSQPTTAPTKTTATPAPATAAKTTATPIAAYPKSNRNSLAPPSRPAPRIPPTTTPQPSTSSQPEEPIPTTTQPPAETDKKKSRVKSIILKPDVDFDRNTAQFDSKSLQDQLKQMEQDEKKDYEWMDSSSDEGEHSSSSLSLSSSKETETVVQPPAELIEESSDDDEPMDVCSRVQPKGNQVVVEFSRDTVSLDRETVNQQLQEEHKRRIEEAEKKLAEEAQKRAIEEAEKKPTEEVEPKRLSVRQTQSQDDVTVRVPITQTQPAEENPTQIRRRSNTVDNFNGSPIIKNKSMARSATTSSPSSLSPTTSPRGTATSPKGTARGVPETPKGTASSSMRREWQSLSAFEQTKHIQDLATEATIRICMIGMDSGKTSLITRFLEQEFTESSDPTVEDCHSVTVSFDGTGNTNYKLEIYDCGSTFYNAFKNKWLQNADSFIIVYSVANKTSFDSVSMFIDDIIKIKNNKLVPILLCGNKVDVKTRVVSTYEGRQLSEHFRCGFMEVSAASGHNVNQMFQYITDTVVRLRTLSISEQQIDMASLYTGWVHKRKKGNFWKKRYIIVTVNAIRYFHKVPNNMNDNSSIKGLIPLKGLVVTCDKHEAESLLRSRLPKKGSPANFQPATISRGGSSDGKNMFLLTNQNVLYELKLAATDQRNALIRVIQEVLDQQHTEDKMHTTPTTEAPKPVQETETTDVTLDKETLIKKVSQMFNNQSADNAIKMFVSWHQQNEKDADIQTAIANFLMSEGMSKRKLGDYLGHPDNIDVMNKFMSLVSFAGLKFDDGLRQLLQLFLLPGEAQKIDRIMEVFATHYCKQNPTAFDNPDTAYVLAFSLIMLNTDAHNKAIPADKKMTKQQFIRNNKGIDQGKDLPDIYLSELYDNIVSNEISMDYQRDDMVQWDLQGSVLLQAIGKTLKRPSPMKKWCIISGNCLYAFNAPQDASPHLIVPLQSNMICDIDHQTRFIKISIFQNTIKAAKKSKSKAYSEILISPEDGKLLRWLLALTNSQTGKRLTLATDVSPTLQSS